MGARSPLEWKTIGKIPAHPLSCKCPLPSKATVVAELNKPWLYFVCMATWLGVFSLHAREPQSPISPSTPNLGLTFDSLGLSPQSYVVPDGAVILHAVVRNHSDTAATGFLVGHIVGNAGIENRRRVELKGGESKRFELPLRLPMDWNDWEVDVEVSLNVLDGPREVMVLQDGEPVMRRLSLPRQRKSIVTALALDREPPPASPLRWSPPKIFATYELAMATRVDAALSRQCLDLDTVPFPLNASDWSRIDNVIIANSALLNDAASVSVLRKYLHSGGRVWVMIDLVDTNAVSSLLGEHQQCTTISTIELNRFEVEVPGQSMSVDDRTVDLDTPVPFKRVIQQGGTVLNRIDGWPVTIQMQVGRGVLFLTTLHCSAWLTPRISQWSEDPFNQSDFELRGWAKGFANQIHFERTKPPLNLRTASYPVERIGNPVVSRTLVGSVLVGFCTCLIAFGLWRYRAGELQSIGVVAPVLALAAASPLVGAALLQRHDIPPMVSLLQIAQFESPSGGSLRESAAVYDSQSRSMQLVGRGDGDAVTSDSITSGIRSTTVDDFQSWRLSNRAWPVGTWRYTTDNSLPDAQVVARAQWNDDGLAIDIPDGFPSPLADVVACFVPGAATLGKRIGPNRILIDSEFPAHGERWTLDSIVNDEQRRRATVYRSMLDDERRANVPKRTLCGWTDLWPDGPQWDAPLQRRGAALNLIPIQLATPPVGSLVRIPFPLIEVRYPSPENSTTLFLDTTGRWISQATSIADVKLAFVLPPEVVPLQTTSITIDWDVKAPRRDVRLSCFVPADGSSLELVSLSDPSLPWIGTVEDPRVLKEIEQGKLLLRIEVSEDRRPDNAINWHIEHLRMSVTGRTLARNPLTPTSTP